MAVVLAEFGDTAAVVEREEIVENLGDGGDLILVALVVERDGERRTSETACTGTGGGISLKDPTTQLGRRRRMGSREGGKGCRYRVITACCNCRDAVSS